MAKGKLERIRLESTNQRMLQKDNGVTTHFDYRVHLNSNRVHLNQIILLGLPDFGDRAFSRNAVSGKQRCSSIFAV